MTATRRGVRSRRKDWTAMTTHEEQADPGMARGRGGRDAPMRPTAISAPPAGAGADGRARGVRGRGARQARRRARRRGRLLEALGPGRGGGQRRAGRRCRGPRAAARLDGRRCSPRCRRWPWAVSRASIGGQAWVAGGLALWGGLADAAAVIGRQLLGPVPLGLLALNLAVALCALAALRRLMALQEN